MARNLKECVDCGNQLSPMAKKCGNPQCCSEDPFGKARFDKKMKRLVGVIMIVGAVSFYVYKFGLTNPIEIFTHPLQQSIQ
ncbi:hypothetical protein [Burkholderia sp. AU38729]|uniref:hypothetical protein n=1 Tax=Burkholderia sp. AU38729 TaxID=2879633 RepID=UPI001CF56E86|nr:hypothetical protein [Burkholderia sp. AU38729]MCA8062334.1 hypothetical protein [Burkholderia sp. AU38729]